MRPGTEPIDLPTARELGGRSTLAETEAIRLDARLTDEQRAELASGPVAETLLACWAKSPSADIRGLAAHGAKADGFVLDALVRDPDETVRVVAASRSKLRQPHVELLAADPSHRVRAAIAARELTSPELLAKLRKDSDEDVADAAKANPSYQPGFFARLFGG